MSLQIIEKDGKPEWAIVPYENYLQMVESIEMLQDIRDYDAAKESLERGEELIPSEVTYAILDGENPIKIWREYRLLTQEQLANSTGLDLQRLVQIEAGEKQATKEEMASLAKALGNSLDYFLE